MVYPRFPECVGVFRCVERPTYDDLLNKQIDDVIRPRAGASSKSCSPATIPGSWNNQGPVVPDWATPDHGP